MDNSLMGKSKELEIASRLADAGFYVFWPFVDKGFDLVITNDKGNKFVPIQVKYRQSDPSLCLDRRDVDRFSGNEVVLVFLIGERPDQKVWYIPFDKWNEMSVDRNRRDNKLYVPISKNEKRLESFKEDNVLKLLRSAFDHKKRTSSTD